MIDTAARHQVRQRADRRCEYCHLPEEFAEVPFHVEHIVARQHRVEDDLSNLALACDRCNLYKGPNLSSIDPTSNLVVNLFHPRLDSWEDHFLLQGSEILGLTPSGRASVRLLKMNSPRRVQVRRQLLNMGVAF